MLNACAAVQRFSEQGQILLINKTGLTFMDLVKIGDVTGSHVREAQARNRELLKTAEATE
jgi:hypothetical protein